jgi:ribosome-associated protein
MHIVITPSVSIPRSELVLQAARSSGPGGQHVNKVSTRVILKFNAETSPSLPPAIRTRFLKAHANRISAEGWMIISCDTHRSRLRNEAECIERLQKMLQEVATPPRRRRATRPTRASKERRLQSKRVQSQRKKGRKKPSRADD